MSDHVLRIRRADVVVESPSQTAIRFFTQDRSSTGSRSYDAYVMSGESPAHRITAQDVRAINATMGARSPRSDWARLIKRGDLPQLESIGRDIDLISMLTEGAVNQGPHVVQVVDDEHPPAR